MASNIQFSFLELADVQPMSFVDVGSAWRQQDFYDLAARNNGLIHAFDPFDTQPHKNMSESGFHYHPYLIGKGENVNFYETEVGYTSSTFPPNLEVASAYSGLPELLNLKKIHQMQSVRLDSIPSIKSIDLLKADVQGGELDVLIGAGNLLSETLVAQLEVGFVELYVGQPMFADIDSYMRSRGFQFHRFYSKGLVLFAPWQQPDPNQLFGISQQLWGEAIYIRDISAIDRMSSEAQLKFIAIMHDVYRSFDLCLHALTKVRGAETKKVVDQYVERLNRRDDAP